MAAEKQVIRAQIYPGKYGILCVDMDDCVRNGWRPLDVPWVVRVSVLQF